MFSMKKSFFFVFKTFPSNDRNTERSITVALNARFFFFFFFFFKTIFHGDYVFSKTSDYSKICVFSHLHRDRGNSKRYTSNLLWFNRVWSFSLSRLIWSVFKKLYLELWQISRWIDDNTFYRTCLHTQIEAFGMCSPENITYICMFYFPISRLKVTFICEEITESLISSKSHLWHDPLRRFTSE